MKTYKTRILALVILDPNGHTYDILAHELDDGRLLTISSGNDGGDTLWASLSAYVPAGVDKLIAVQDRGFGTVSLAELVAADAENTDYGGKSLVTSEEWAEYAQDNSDKT